MKKVFIRFYEELNDFLPKEKKKTRFVHEFIDRTSVKDLVESLGVPHTEIDLILVNGKSVRFDYLINDGHDISVYPVFESFDIRDVQHLRPEPLREPKFIADVHLGKLTKYLRMLGYDVCYNNHLIDTEIVKIAREEKITILTRDLGILKRAEVTHGYFIRSQSAQKQTEEVIERFDLFREIKEFTRCMECNSELAAVPMEEVLEMLPPKVAASQTRFYKCSGCNKVYWRGTHHQHMQSLVKKIKNIKL